MSGVNVIERVGARLDAMQARLDMIAETNQAQLQALRETIQVQLQALQDSIQATRWLLGIGMTIIGLIVAYGTFFGG